MRAEAGAYLLDHARREFNIPGVTFGIRYDASPIVLADAAPPPDEINRYVPSGVPGGRAPHAWLADGGSLYDRLGRDFTLLQLAAGGRVTGSSMRRAHLAIPLAQLDLSREPGGARVARAVRRRPRARPAGPAPRLARRTHAPTRARARASDRAGYSSRRSFAAVFPRMSSRSAAGTASSRFTVPTGSVSPMSKQ